MKNTVTIYRWIKPLILSIAGFIAALSCAGSGFLYPLDDQPVIIKESGFNTAVSEKTGSDSYTIQLGMDPSAAITIEAAFDTTEMTLNGNSVSPQTFTFTPGACPGTGDWCTPQTVTVKAVDNTVTDGDRVSAINHTVLLPAPAEFTGLTLKDVNVSITDNESAGIYLYETGNSTNVIEDNLTTDTYELVLKSDPGSSVEIAVGFIDAQINVNGSTVSPQTLTFTAGACPGTGNWCTPQTVSVTGDIDAFFEDQPHTTTISNTVTLGPAPYLSVNIPDITVSITDMNNPGVIVIEPASGVYVDENGAADIYYVQPNQDPGADIDIEINFNTAQIMVNGSSVSPQILTFTTGPCPATGNWCTPQAVNVEAYDDNAIEGYHWSTIGHSISTGPVGWITPDDFTIVDVNVNIGDNDLKMYLVDPGVNSINRADLIGAATTAAVYPAIVPYDLAVDTAGNRIYFTEESLPDYRISACNLDGSSNAILYTSAAFEVSYNTVSIDINPGEGTVGMVYWVESGGSSRICKAPADGSGPVQEIVTIIPGNLAHGIAVDPTGLRIYWTEEDSGAGDYRIKRARLNGSTIETLYTGFTYLRHIEVHPPDRRLYFGGSDGSNIDNIYSAHMDGGDLSYIISGGGGAVNGFYGITIDGLESRLYWTNSNNDTVYRMFWDGTMIEDATPTAGVTTLSGIDLGGMP